MDKSERADFADALWREGCEFEDAGKLDAAIVVYRRGAELGSEHAQNNLGTLLADYAGQPKEAVYWYKRAVRQGSSVAAANLAVHYKTLNQRRWHMHWLTVAADLGDEECADELAALSPRR